MAHVEPPGSTFVQVKAALSRAWAEFGMGFGPPVLCLLALVGIADWAAPAWAAATGHGTRGTYTAQWCMETRNGCDWHGRFVSDDGTVVRVGAGIEPNRSVDVVGHTVPAIDTGGGVFAVGSGEAWLRTAPVVPILAFAGLWTGKVTVPMQRYRRRAALVPRTRPPVPAPEGTAD